MIGLIRLAIKPLTITVMMRMIKMMMKIIMEARSSEEDTKKVHPSKN